MHLLVTGATGMMCYEFKGGRGSPGGNRSGDIFLALSVANAAPWAGRLTR